MKHCIGMANGIRKNDFQYGLFFVTKYYIYL